MTRTPPPTSETDAMCEERARELLAAELDRTHPSWAPTATRLRADEHYQNETVIVSAALRAIETALKETDTAFPMLISREHLRQRIEADPDLETEARPSLSDAMCVRLGELLEKATKGPWEVETIKCDGEYGPGPDPGVGFAVSTIIAPCGKAAGKTLFDALNSDACEVAEDWPDEYGDVDAHDAVSAANAALIVEAINALPTLLSDRTALITRVEELEAGRPGGLSSCGPSPSVSAVTASIPDARVERLALNLRAYAYARGASREDADEEVALAAARSILSAMVPQL